MVVGQREFAWTPDDPIGVNWQEGLIASMSIALTAPRRAHLSSRARREAPDNVA
jgi:hypothetical protein